MTRDEWAHSFLGAIGAPTPKRNLLVIVSWIQAEGGNARWNPLNTTWPSAGSTIYNSVGVRNYPSFREGLDATVRTIQGRGLGYGEIRERLKDGAGAAGTLRAIERSEWGTGGLALACLPWVKLRWDHYRNLTING